MHTDETRIGDKCELRSGGPLMTVAKKITYKSEVCKGDKIPNGDLECMWFDDNKCLHVATFPARVLIRPEQK